MKNILIIVFLASSLSAGVRYQNIKTIKDCMVVLEHGITKSYVDLRYLQTLKYQKSGSNIIVYFDRKTATNLSISKRYSWKQLFKKYKMCKNFN